MTLSYIYKFLEIFGLDYVPYQTIKSHVFIIITNFLWKSSFVISVLVGIAIKIAMFFWKKHNCLNKTVH